MGFNQHKRGKHLPCLMSPKFYVSEAMGSEKEDFYIFLCIYMVQTQATLGRIHIGHLGYYLNKLVLGPEGKATNQISSS